MDFGLGERALLVCGDQCADGVVAVVRRVTAAFVEDFVGEGGYRAGGRCGGGGVGGEAGLPGEVVGELRPDGGGHAQDGTGDTRGQGAGEGVHQVARVVAFGHGVQGVVDDPGHRVPVSLGCCAVVVGREDPADAAVVGGVEIEDRSRDRGDVVADEARCACEGQVAGEAPVCEYRGDVVLACDHPRRGSRGQGNRADRVVSAGPVDERRRSAQRPWGEGI
ncbi:hypothetical protein [Streptomyces sp. NPDC091268]|uniref:hypothetical protein n=1 Tax=Streptomyces sp. NPDC091268 TaxID=3365979 RepID=UPI00382A2BAE